MTLPEGHTAATAVTAEVADHAHAVAQEAHAMAEEAQNTAGIAVDAAVEAQRHAEEAAHDVASQVQEPEVAVEPEPVSESHPVWVDEFHKRLDSIDSKFADIETRLAPPAETSEPEVVEVETEPELKTAEKPATNKTEKAGGEDTTNERASSNRRHRFGKR